MSKPVSLDHQALAALQQAMAEGRMEVAEHLLCALEALGADARANPPLAAAYASLIPARRCPAISTSRARRSDRRR
ncbi:hypothetical protein [Geminicoccus flavidas]|uniref:hypothetical protein n=1 Tax=Geminicoccus flavidas TaxID=2506407 RepID=UPI001359223D|nr:hypothetical protein [Geminicoccus flavidas]